MFDLGKRAAIVAALFAISSFADTADEADHHEHPGVTDAAPGDAAHHHGDSDDHHDAPDSPCHHHVVHCDCSTGVICLPVEDSGPASLEPVLTALPPLASRSISPFASAIFHVPIA